MTDTRIAVISAGLSQPSSTRLLADRLAAATARSLPERAREAEVAGPGFTDAEFTDAEFNGAEFTVIELRDHAHDLANNLVTGFPSPALREVTEAVTTASGLIAVTPIFNASYSGLFKTFFDVLEPDSLTGMPVLLGATGGTERHSLALEHALRPMFAYLRSIVVPTAGEAAPAHGGGGAAGAGKGPPHARAARGHVDRGTRPRVAGRVSGSP
uniref:CE1759 family FMN reductase n=1 Tax=Nocardia farcinica TaxID=37329 RepID=UPI002455A3E6